MSSAVRESGVAIDHVIAELAAFPLSSSQAFRYAATKIGPIHHHSPTRRLWRAAEREVLRSIQGVGIDEFTSLRDRLWFGFLTREDKLQLSRLSRLSKTQRESSDQKSLPSEPLHRYLRRLSERNLQVDGAVARPALGPARRALDMTGSLQSRMARNGWLWLVLALPADLLTSVMPGARQVETVSPMLERMLADKGFAELHVHLGAAIEFPWLWIAMQHAIAEPDCPADIFSSPGADLDEGRVMASWMVRAAIARFLLAWYLQRRSARAQVLPVTDFEKAVLKRLREQSKDLAAQLSAESCGEQKKDEAPKIQNLRSVKKKIDAEIEEIETTWKERDRQRENRERNGTRKRSLRSDLEVLSLTDFLAKNFDVSFVHNVNGVAAWEIDAAIRPLLSPDKEVSDSKRFVWLQSVYRRLVRPHRHHVSTLEDAAWTDPISRYFPPGPGTGQTPEQDLMRQSIAWLEDLEQNGKQDLLFEQLFWQVQRVRCVFYRFIVQRPNTPGLQWFLRFYSRIHTARDPFFDVELLLESAASVSGSGRGLKSLEVRTSSGEECSSTFLFVRDFGNKARDLIRQADSAEPHEKDRHPKHRAAFHDPDRALKPRVPPHDRTHAKRRTRSSQLRPRLIKNESRLEEVGLVIHFARDRGAGARQGAQEAHLIQGEGDPSVHRYRYAGCYRRFRKEAMSPGWLLEHFPLSLQWLRGIDVCADEAGVPPWVFVPLFQFLRERSRRASRAIQSRYGVSVPPMRTTAHAGEDFIHLLTGLRYIDETIECFDLREGDRLGHALALRIDPVDWCRRAGPTTISLHDRLFDLVWEWTVRDRAFQAGLSDRMQFIEYEIQQLAHRLYASTDEVPGIFELAQLMKDLRHAQGSQPERDGDPATSQDLRFLIGFPDLDPLLARERLFGSGQTFFQESSNPSDQQQVQDVLQSTMKQMHDLNSPGAGKNSSSLQKRLQRLFTYLTDAELYHRGQTPISVDPQQAGPALERIQKALRRKVASRGIVIEINPTSNLLIGDLNDLRNAPFWRLQETGDDGSTRPVSLCLGTDDPLVFASDLRQEYQRLVDAMGMAGFSDDEARSMLDHIRETGLAARFTLPTVIDGSITDLRMPASHFRSGVRI
jgi:hypothetical protein